MYSTTLTSAPVQSAIRLSRNPFGTAVNGITRYSFASETASVSAGISPTHPSHPSKKRARTAGRQCEPTSQNRMGGERARERFGPVAAYIGVPFCLFLNSGFRPPGQALLCHFCEAGPQEFGIRR